ncbi:STM4014 family protein [Dactylosporangium sp. NPDC005555]|uniref:STM4014 family protein n=1 Tax=Dactylosporangium sp. NPDC005555 TaxID=3154889 RepID=UPI0033B543B9
MTTVIVVGVPGHRRVRLFRDAAVAAGLPEPTVVSWRDVCAGGPSDGGAIGGAGRPAGGGPSGGDGPAGGGASAGGGAIGGAGQPAGGGARSGVVGSVGGGGPTWVRLESPGEDAEIDRLLRGAVTEAAHGEIVGLAAWHRGFVAAARWVEAWGLPMLTAVDELDVMFDKRRCHALLRSRGVAVPAAFTAGSYEEIRDRGWRRVFVKPPHGSSASGVIALAFGGPRMSGGSRESAGVPGSSGPEDGGTRGGGVLGSGGVLGIDRVLGNGGSRESGGVSGSRGSGDGGARSGGGVLGSGGASGSSGSPGSGGGRGSGGVRGNGRVSAYTSAVLDDGRLYNELRVRHYTDERTVAAIIDRLAVDGLHVERWLPKASHDGLVFDLRVLVVAGRVSHVVVRTGESPMTNLHLGNARGDLPGVRAAAGEEHWAAAMRTCEAAAACFPGTLHVGVDLMFGRDYSTHAVAEVNAFGDLLPGLLVDGRDTYAAEIDALLSGRFPVAGPCGRDVGASAGVR